MKPIHVTIVHSKFINNSALHDGGVLSVFKIILEVTF